MQWIPRVVEHCKSIVRGEAIVIVLYQYGTGIEAEMTIIFADHHGAIWVMY